jgi:hypothetical protein
MKLFYVLAYLLIAGSLAIFILPATASPDWLSGYSYRKSHVLLSSTNAGTDYQVKIQAYYGSGVDSLEKIYLESKCKTDFEDMAFTDSNGTTLLNYWMQEKVTANYAIFWIKITGDLGTANQTIYIYYGNSAATSSSDFDSTFVFGELFNNSTLNATKWTSVDGNPSYVINTVNHYLEVTTMDTSNWWNGKGFHSRTFVFPSQYIMEDAYSSLGQQMSLYIEASGNIFGGLFSVHHASYSGSDFGIAYSKIRKDGDSDFQYSKQAGVGGNDYDWTSGLITGQAQNWYDLRTRIWKLSTNATAEVDGTVRVNQTSSETPDRIHLGIARSSPNLFGTIRFYGFKIRKYVSPEPIHGSWGTEEHLPVVPTNSNRWLGIALPHVYAAIGLWSLAMIIGVGVVLMQWQTLKAIDLVAVILLGIGILICLFISLAVMSGFLRL